MRTIEDLASELDVTAEEIRVYLRQLIDLDGRDAVIAREYETGHHIGSYPIVVTELTEAAAESIRLAIDATREA